MNRHSQIARCEITEKPALVIRRRGVIFHRINW